MRGNEKEGVYTRVHERERARERESSGRLREHWMSREARRKQRNTEAKRTPLNKKQTKTKTNCKTKARLKQKIAGHDANRRICSWSKKMKLKAKPKQ